MNTDVRYETRRIPDAIKARFFDAALAHKNDDARMHVSQVGGARQQHCLFPRETAIPTVLELSTRSRTYGLGASIGTRYKATLDKKTWVFETTVTLWVGPVESDEAAMSEHLTTEIYDVETGEWKFKKPRKTRSAPDGS